MSQNLVNFKLKKSMIAKLENTEIKKPEFRRPTVENLGSATIVALNIHYNTSKRYMLAIIGIFSKAHLKKTCYLWMKNPLRISLRNSELQTCKLQ